MIVWTHAVFSVLYASVLYFFISSCSAPLSMFYMERRSRNAIIIIIIIIIITIIIIRSISIVVVVVVVAGGIIIIISTHCQVKKGMRWGLGDGRGVGLEKHCEDVHTSMLC